MKSIYGKGKIRKDSDTKISIKYIENNTWAHVDTEFLFEFNTRREIPYLQATRSYFVYHINTIALY